VLLPRVERLEAFRVDHLTVDAKADVAVTSCLLQEFSMFALSVGQKRGEDEDPGPFA
jgi:hypothetical protein